MSKPTYSLSELLGASRDAANRTRSSREPSPCVSCKRTLAILPLRYGVIAGDNQANVKALAPALPANLGKKLAPKLTSGSRYADRCLLGPLLGFVHAGLGRATTLLRMRELASAGQTANPRRVTGQVNAHIGRVRDTLTAEFQNGGAGSSTRFEPASSWR